MDSQIRNARPIDRLVEILGWLALFSCLALLSPGLVVSASAEPNSSQVSVAEGATCSAGEATSERLTLQLQQQLAALEARAVAQAGEGDTSGVIMLNNSGFNYRPKPGRPAETSVEDR